ncbi:family 10 glycosylhydrolase [Pseudoflavitalea sp. X16]|uniref:family 10 glycosylhydrolase n=1 Tax=Paraflavitalea devenefica TaxID=2716334 RepID=UPI00142095F8|nr:family 10 glycosylhydrolase [Paraflavitalea devenefica]NII24862.1 family 10 glycosylhydrolase [Paraflavitalea devenefica]
MPSKLLSFTTAIVIIFLLHSCAASKKSPVTQAFPAPSAAPKAAKEFRAAWVATVANINWPSKPGLSTEQQKQEAIVLLDFLKANNFNAVVFQVRPQADALYQSALEPWSYYLTGTQGKAPSPFYDPLEFWTEAAHDRGLELHVWLNPYRAHHTVGGEVSDSSIVKKRPELVVKLKQGNYWWFDPALKGTQDHSAAVVMDIVKRYDIDGVHFDDYFYPYPDYNLGQDFPDSVSYAAYKAGGGKLERGDWRRHAVNTFIERLYKEIKAEKKHVKFGLSPFGIWRPGYPEYVAGFDQYSVLYADAKLWLNEGWIDYFAPQLYWPISRQSQSFPILLGWWTGENTKERHLWPGMSVGTDTSIRNVNEIIGQIMTTRGMLPKSAGAIHWSISQLTKNPNMINGILNGPYKKQALIPASPWLDNKAPEAPAVTLDQLGNALQVSWTHPDAKDVFHYVVYHKYKDKSGNPFWNYKIMNRNDRSATIEIPQGGNVPTHIAVTAVDRTGNESTLQEIENTVKMVTPAAAIVPRSGWNAAAPKPFKQHVPVKLTIHHEGTAFDSTKDAAKHIKNVQTWGMGKDRNWVDIPYHFLIAPDGTIYEGRSVYTVGETATEYDPAGHLLISCLGNFETQEVPQKQLEALTRLIAYCCKKYNIPFETIASHKDHSAKTDCPGKNLYQYLQNGYIKTKVKELMN